MNSTEESTIDKIMATNQLIDSLNANSFVDKIQENQFNKNFLKPDFDVFIILVNSFNQLKENSFKRNKLLSLISDYIYSEQTLQTLLSKTCQMSSTELDIIGTKLETILITIPDIVSNNMKSNYCQNFNPNLYFKRMVETIYFCVEEVFQSINTGTDSSLQFLSSLLGRIAFIGYSQIVFKEVLYKLLINCENDFIWRRIAYRLIVVQQKQEYIEVLVKTIFCLAQNYRTIVWIIGNCAETKPKIKFLITNKFLLINEFKSDTILVNIFGYLSENCLQLFFGAFHNLLNGWSNSSAIKYRSYSQHLYLSRALMIGSRFMKDLDFSEVENNFRRLTMNGIEIHLKNSQTDFRNIGLTVGQTLMTLFCRETNKIDFEIQENDEIKHLNDLFINNCNVNEVQSIEQKNSPQIGPKVTELSKEVNSSNLDSDDDEDNDLIPYDLSNDIPNEDKKIPVYLRDCMEGLLDPEKIEWFTSCLRSAEQIIRKNSDSIEELSIEFTQILFRLDDNYAISDFVGLRLRALIALCVCSPKSVANYLCSLFYAQNHTIRQRLDVLEVLVSASSELSSNTKIYSEENKIKEISDVSDEEITAENHWKQVVNSRIETKTRIISHKTKDMSDKTFVNRLAPVVSNFFFPLLKNIDKNEIKFDLYEEDHYVFGRLLYTLGIIIKNVSFCPITKQMGRELLDFILAFRYHSEVFVREALIFAFCMVLMSVPPIYLMNEMSVQIVELQLWLKDITEREVNAQCVQKAMTALHFLKEVVKEMPLTLSVK